MKPPFRIVVKARRLSWLPSIWPNTSWIVMESPPGTTWQEAHDLAHQFKDAGALFVQVQGRNANSASQTTRATTAQEDAVIERRQGANTLRGCLEQAGESHAAVSPFDDGGTRTPLPPRVFAFDPVEILRSEKHQDGLWHAAYPTATATLCSRPREPQTAGRPGLPTCVQCVKTAAVFGRIDGSMPENWPVAT